jgi:hypothetical protein
MTCVPHAGDIIQPGTQSAELWRFDTSTRGWKRVDNTATSGAGPSGRYGHVMTFVGMDLWLHGGSINSGEGDACSSPAVLLLLLS